MGVQRHPHNVTTYEATQKTVWFITNYAEEQVILYHGAWVNQRLPPVLQILCYPVNNTVM